MLKVEGGAPQWGAVCPVIGGALRGNSAPQGRALPAGWVAENKNGQSPFLVGAREGAALPLNDFDFNDFDFLKIKSPRRPLFGR